MSVDKKVRVRFAPSPTGYLHVGGARTALFNYLFAKKNKGTFVLRIEDTDLERSTEESLRMQLDDLKWLELDWDEGVDFISLEDVGNYGPYRQSKRLDIYKKYVDQMIEQGSAYYCFHSDEEIEKIKEDNSGTLISQYRDYSKNEALKRVEKGDSFTVRFKNFSEVKEYKINDLVRGEVKFPSDMVGDFVLMRSNGMPVYNFCCAIDDGLMEISHVFRAEEHLSNTLRQLMIYEACDMSPPQFGHLSLILGEDKQKLSKRHGATSCHEYNENGFLPEAINNFIALLGWNPGKDQEIISMSEMKEKFSTERINSSPAVFDDTKLRWMNSVYIKQSDSKKLWSDLEPILNKEGLSFPEDRQWQSTAVDYFKTSSETLVELVEKIKPLSSEGFIIDESGAEALSWDTSKAVLEKWLVLLSENTNDLITAEEMGSYQKTVQKECEVKGKNLFMPLRTSVIGSAHGADIKVVGPLIGRKQLMSRAELCLKQMNK